MGRSKSDTVDYFPHIAKTGKTLFILEGQFGNDGYAFWFKLLEILATSEGHFYDASVEANWHYLIARAKITPQSATEILDLLATLGNIDTELWKTSKIVWCQAFLDNLTEVYRKRKRDLPKRPEVLICDRNDNNCDGNVGSTPQSATESTQRIVEKSIVKKRKETPLNPPKPKKSEVPLPENYGISDSVREWADRKGFNHLEAHLEAFVDYAKSRGKTYVDWDSAFKRAIREDWGKVRQGGGLPALPGQRSQPMSKAEQVTAANLRAAREAMDE